MGKIIDHNNFWYIEKNPISKTGVFPYLGREIGFPGLEPNKIYYVLRSEQELMSPEAIKSFELLPITKGHRMLGPQEQGLTPAEKIPQQGIVGEKVFAEGDTLYANIKVTSEQAKNDINNGLKELSLGYFCRWVKETGEYKGRHYDFAQKNIRGNHLAIVPLGRMGHDVRVMDSLPVGAASYACDSLELAGPFVSALLPAGHIPLKLFSLPGQAQDWQESDHPRKKDGKFAPKGQGESGKAKNEEKTEKQDIFTPSAELAERFKKEVQAVLADDSISKNHLLDMGAIPPLYIKLGLPNSKLKINKMTMLKALGKAGRHAHDVPQEVLENLPALISDPEGVFKSSLESTNPNGFVAVLNAVNKDGKQILAAISPNEKGESGFNFIPSVYDKKNFENFVNKTNNENGIIYIKEKGSDLWGPLQSRPLHSQSLINKILTKEDFVKDLDSLKKEELSDMSITEMLENAEDGMNLFIEEADHAGDDWDESKHKRDAEGKFTSGGGAAEIKRKQEERAAKKAEIERRAGKFEAGTAYKKAMENNPNDKQAAMIAEARSLSKWSKTAYANPQSAKSVFFTRASQNDYIKQMGRGWLEDIFNSVKGTKTNGTDGISAAPEDKESIKMDKRKVIEEIMAIAAKPADEFKDGKEEQIKTIAGLAEKLAYNKSERGANDEDAAKDKDKAKDEDNSSKTDKDADKAEDAMEARIAANFAKKAALYEKVSPFTGSFDHNPMTLSQMAKYACDKLGIKGVAEDGAQTALEGYLVGAQKQAVVRQAKGATMDAAPESDAAFENYLKEAE